MPEERGLYPAMELFDQVEYFALLHGMDGPAAARAAKHWIDRLGLSGREGTRIDALSHGNQQRAQLAVALVHDPELLVLDEPFSGLDPGGIDDMSSILRERAAAGVTVLFSSHQLDLVEDICEAVAIIHHGRLVVSGPVAELRRGDRPRLAVRVSGDTAAAWAAGLGETSGTVDAVRAGWHGGDIPNEFGRLSDDPGSRQGGGARGALRLRGPVAFRGVPPGHGGLGRARRRPSTPRRAWQAAVTTGARR